MEIQVCAHILVLNLKSLIWFKLFVIEISNQKSWISFTADFFKGGLGSGTKHFKYNLIESLRSSVVAKLNLN